MSVTDWSKTPASNASLESTPLSSAMPVLGVSGAFAQIMADVRELYDLTNMTRAQAETATIPAPVTRIRVDGLNFVRDASGTALTTVGATWSPDDDSVSLEHWGAVPGDISDLAPGDITAAKVLATGAQDCSTAGQRMAAWLVAQGGGHVRLLPNKIYYKDDADGTVWDYSGAKNITFECAGGAFIFWDDKPTVPRADGNHFMIVSSTDGLTFQGLRIVSTREEYIDDITSDDLTEGKNCIVGTGIGDIKFIRCSFENMRWFVTSLNEVRDALFDSNTINGSGRDGFRCRQYRNMRAIGNTLIGCQDDAIVGAGTKTPTDTGSDIVPTSFVAVNNYISDGWGIRAVQASETIIEGNILHRITRHGIEVYEDSALFPAGSATIQSLSILNNKLLNCMGLKAPSDGIVGAIKVKTAARDLVSGDVPGLEVPVYPYAYQTDTDSGTNVGGRRIVIAGNEVARTLPAVANYEDWGFGPYQDRTYGADISVYHNPAVTDGDFVQYGIYLEGPMTGVEVRENNISGLSDGGNAIRWTESSAPTGIEFEGVIGGNSVRDVQEHCIRLHAANSEIRARIRGNYLDGDPFRRANIHNGDNTWANTGAVRGVQWDEGTGIVHIEGNHGLNISAMALPSARMIYRDNTVYADFADSGFDAANKGVGHLNQNDIVVDIDGDPSSGTFMQVRTVPLMHSLTIPNTGKYLIGHFVESLDPSASGGRVVRGWLRRTTGTSHVSGTDWYPTYVTIT